MGSTVCVRCGGTLVPRSYCDVCHDILYFTCSSCSMSTDERIHTYCHNISSINNNYDIYLQDTQKIIDNTTTNVSQLLIGINYVNTHLYFQNQLNDKIKDSSIKLLTSYWSSVSDSMKLINRYCVKIFKIGDIWFKK